MKPKLVNSRLMYVKRNKGRFVLDLQICAQEKKMNNETTFLVKRAQRRDKEAFCKLMNLYLKDMYRTAIAILANEEDAGDAMQDTILTCWEKLNTLKKTQFFKTWMTRILMNHCYDILRQKSVYVDLDKYEETSTYDEYNIEFKEALDSIVEKYRLPIELFYGQGYKVKEIAELLSLPQNTIKTYLSRGRKQLAKFYGGELK